MKQNAQINLLVLAGIITLLAACQFRSIPAHTPALVVQNPQPLPQAASPLPVARESLDSIRAYRVVLHTEMLQTQPDGSVNAAVSEYNYTQTSSANPYGYNAHRVTTLVDPQSGTPVVMDEGYVVDDLGYTYCPTCPIPAEQMGWSVGKRSEGAFSNSARKIEIDNLSFPLADLVAQSSVIGDEAINDISTTHYRLTDVQALREPIRWRTGGAPDTPLDVKMAQVDIWLTVGDHQSIQYTFQAEGNTESIAGSQLLQPFTIHEQYNVTEVDSHLTITVPAEVLDRVEAQRKTLKIK